MNLLHIKYALEVAKSGSLSKASEVLLIAPPNISRSIKDLEADLGITIFDRTTKGMELTPEGEEFISFAQGIISQVEQMEKYYRAGLPKKQKFSISVPRADYISEAFAMFSKSLTGDSAEIYYNETNAQHTIRNILEHDYKLGIVRYAAYYDKYFKTLFEEKGLCYELIAEFSSVVLMSRESPLAGKAALTADDLNEYIEIAHADQYVPSVPLSKVAGEELTAHVNRRIFVFERASQLELLSRNAGTFMWVSPLPADTLARYRLTEKPCEDNRKLYKDVLIFREGYKLSNLDKRFITELCEAKRRIL